MSELVSALPQRRTATDRLTDVSSDVSAAIVAEVLAGGSDVIPPELGAVQSVDTTEGARLILENGVILTIRPSGNAPELRCYVEAETAGKASAILADVMGRLTAKVAP